MMVEIASCATLNRSVSSSIPLSTAACATTKRTKHFSAISGFLSSVKLPQVFTTPMTKNSTSRAYATAFSPSLMFTITFQTLPPLKFSGVVLMSVQISPNLSFQVARALLRLSAIHEPVPVKHHLPV